MKRISRIIGTARNRETTSKAVPMRGFSRPKPAKQSLESWILIFNPACYSYVRIFDIIERKKCNPNPDSIQSRRTRVG